ncbi:MAG TPA: N-acetylmuramoyl-L-alanine amidase, partial [Desulfomonilia bacterium]|nr:N-acetylmuramoyl-L-alanine amidase [Desulfomonilia bacterium]
MKSKQDKTTIIVIISIMLFVLGMSMPMLASSGGGIDRQKVFKIVIDPGHGGKDPGAIGPGGAKEKDITLAVSKSLASRLREGGIEVFLTRNGDTFIPLEERTAFANKKKAKLFISVHVNANDRESFQGIETYFLNLTTDASSLKVADRENAVTS